MTAGRLVAAALTLLVLSTAAGPGFAHSGAKPGDGLPRGIPIANLTHGQMAVIAEYRSEILALADRSPAADEAFRRVRNYANIQFAWCAWNLMPGGIADEASPFNACMHAHLAAIRDLLLRMRAQPDAGGAATELADRVDRSMMLAGAALVLCQYSADGFDTARVVGPDWAALPGHIPTLLSLTGALALAAAGLFGLRRLGRPAAGLPRYPAPR